MSRNAGPLVGAAFALALASTPSHALTFHFSFNNALANDPAQSLVEGTISGLQDIATIQSAASVQVTSNPAGFGLIEYAGVTANNQFLVSAGELTEVNFESFGNVNGTCCSLLLSLIGSGRVAGLTNNIGGVSIAVTNLVFTAETPLPAALPLFATGLGALGLLGWRRKRKAAALAA